MTEAMWAMQLNAPGEALLLVSRPKPQPGSHEVLLEIRACGVCRTDLHIADGDLKGPKPIVLGHEIVGRVLSLGTKVSEVREGYAELRSRTRVRLGRRFRQTSAL